MDIILIGFHFSPAIVVKEGEVTQLQKGECGSATFG
ncbi:uncharacterized protein G2W53_035349 [Senna tora]|uniref:Uncharacterized protein n=1 Tax=Senna tora TaxID=362788 RepID=A0A834SSK7_9FABA|nr:uncharacterized protein G2W53_035349 [Senna tora]